MVRRLDPDDLYRVPFPSDPQLSPDGLQVAFVVAVADKPTDEMRTRISSVGVGGGHVEPLTAGPFDHSPRWSSDGRWLAFVSSPAAGGTGQLWLLPAGGGPPRQLTDLAGGADTPVWAPDGQRIAFVSTASTAPDDNDEHAPIVVTRLDYRRDGVGLTAGRHRHLFVVEVHGGGAPVQWTAGDFSVAGPAWSPDGQRIAFASAMHADRDLDAATALFVVDAGHEPRQLTPASASAGSPAWSPDGSTIVYAGALDLGVGHQRLLAVPAEGGDPREVARPFDRNVMVGGPAYPGAPPRVLEDGSVLFCARDKGCTHVYRVALDGGVPNKVAGGQTRSVAGVSPLGDGSMLALVAATPESPGEVWVQCLEYERQITRLMADALGDVELFRPEARRFRAPDRVDLFGWVLRDPAAPVPGPLLLDIHGGPHNAWAPVFDGVDLHHQMLAAAGWTVLLVNPRGSDGYGEEFYRGVTGAWGRADLDDFLVATCGLVAEGVADPKRLAVSGYSYGGYMTCWLTSQTDWFTSAVAGGCVTDLAGFVGATDVGPRAAVELGGPPHEHAARYADLSPMTHVAEVATPTLLLHGEADLRCPIDQADRWFAALRRLGQTVELVRYPGADHLFVVTGRPSHRVDYCRRLVDWVVTHDGPRVPVAYRQGRHTR